MVVRIKIQLNSLLLHLILKDVSGTISTNTIWKKGTYVVTG